MKKLSSITVLTVLLLLGMSIAKASELPKGCRILDVNKPDIELSSAKDLMFYIQNDHTSDIYLADKDDPLRTIKISPKHWGVFIAKAKQPSEFSCIESKPGSEQKLACQGMIKICQIETMKYGEPYLNGFWAAQDLTLDQSIDALTLKHISYG